MEVNGTEMDWKLIVIGMNNVFIALHWDLERRAIDYWYVNTWNKQKLDLKICNIEHADS